MKKLILVLTGILLVVYVLLSVLSLHGVYNAERELWGIDHQLNFIATHLESTPDFTIDQLAKKYQAYAKKQNGHIFAYRAQLKLGDLYAIKKNYPEARLEYLRAVGPDKGLSALAEFAVAKTYELENRWDRALPIYKNIIQDYPATNTGFFLPMYLTIHLNESGEQKINIDQAYADALSFYQRMALKYPKSEFEFNSLRMISICQLNQNNWLGAVNAMQRVMMEYPYGKAIQEAVSTINVMCVTKLHDYDLGIKIYKQFIQKYPDNPADPALKKMIQELKVLKNKKVVITTSPAPAAK